MKSKQQKAVSPIKEQGTEIFREQEERKIFGCIAVERNSESYAVCFA